MAKPVALSMEALLTQLDRRLGVMERRTGGGLTAGSTIQAVTSSAQLAALVASYRPTPERPLIVMREDVPGHIIQITSDGVLWSTLAPTRSAAPWITIPFTNGWQSYHTNDPNYPVGGYFKTSAGIVVMRSLGRLGTMGQAMFTLPAGYRPDGNMLGMNVSANAFGVFRIYTDGAFVQAVGSNAWAALDGIMFPAADASRVWTPLALTNGWQDYNAVDASFPPASFWVDPFGRAWFRGMLRRTAGVPTTGSIIATNLPNMPSTRIVVGTGANAPAHLSVGGANIAWATGGSPAAWMSLPTFPMTDSTVTGWVDMPFSSGSTWGAYSGWPVPSLKVFPDGIVVARGMAAGGTVGGLMNDAPFNFRADGKAHIFAASVSDTFARLNLSPASQTALGVTSANGWASMTGMAYIAEG